MALKLTNNAVTTLAASITAAATSISIQTADAGKFPVLGAGDWHPATIIDPAGNMEIVRVTARNNGLMTVARAQEGTAAKAFAAGSRLDVRLTVAAVVEIMTGDHTMDQVVGLSDALNARYGKGGGILTGFPILGFNYPQIWFGQAATETGWRILKDNVEGQVGSLVFQWSTDRWNQIGNTAFSLAPDGQARFSYMLRALGGLKVSNDLETFNTTYLATQGGGVEIGRTSGTADTPFIDFHTSATAVDYNVRIIASGGTAGVGQGRLDFQCGGLYVNNQNIWSTGNLGYLTGGEAEAGTSETKRVWSAADVKRAIAALTPPGLARGQYTQDASRLLDTSYQNTTDRPIFVGWFGNGGCILYTSTDTANWVATNVAGLAVGFWPIPPGQFYRWSGGAIGQVRELRA